MLPQLRQRIESVKQLKVQLEADVPDHVSMWQMFEALRTQHADTAELSSRRLSV